MRTRNSKQVIAVFVTALLLTLVLAVSASAAITVDGTTIKGLDASVAYEYAPVTLENYQTPEYTAVSSGSTTITDLTPGIWFVKNTSTNAVTAVWVEGAAEDRDTIGEVYYSDSFKKNVVRAANATGKLDFVAGVWTGTESRNHSTFATYYLSATGAHVGSGVSRELFEGARTFRQVVNNSIKPVCFMYAYAPKEIIPVEELYTLSFRVGVRQGSLELEYEEDAEQLYPRTVYTLYTMDETGAVTEHQASFDTIYANNGTGTTHSISIKGDFPDANGWVIGIKIQPYGEISLKGLSMNAVMDANGGFTNTCYFVEFNPAGYTTENTSTDLEFPFQYNGANKSYIEGYADGTFAPDGEITKAEVATILARLILNGEDIPVGFASSFADVTVNEWFYDAVSYLESHDVFTYIEGARFNPNAPITRGELAQMIQEIADSKDVYTCTFKDVDREHIYFEAIAALENCGVAKGYGDGTFRPDATITRAEAVTMLNRMLNLKVDATTVTTDADSKTFSDIYGHWAENQILMAANDNVKSVHHLEADTSGMTMTSTALNIETEHMKLIIANTNGRVVDIISKYDNSSVIASSVTPWFTYIVTKSGITCFPSSLSIVDGRLKVVYTNFIEAYFIVDVFEHYFTIELDSELPSSIEGIYFGKLSISSEFSEDPDSYRLSAVAMNANTNSANYPGGKAKATSGYAVSKFGTMGAKLGITFSKYEHRITGAHRNYLKEIVDAIDPTVGTTSKAGGAYALDNHDLTGDYVIPSSGVTEATAQYIADVLYEYSIDQLDFHQGGSSFIQGDFNFVCAKRTGETYTSPAQFKERVGNVVTSKGAQLGLHTYSSLISPSATTVLVEPKWQKMLCYEEDYVLTLKEDVTSTSTEFLTNEDASGLILYGAAAGGGYSTMPWSGPNTNYFLIDEEIFRVSMNTTTMVSGATETGLAIAYDSGTKKYQRGVCGTTPAAHKAGAEIRHLYSQYNMFQPIPGSELFYHIADLTAKAYNEGGFEMIYLDGLESFARSSMCDTNYTWYYYSTFIQRVVSGCEIDPIIEGSNILTSFWTSRGRAGAVDHATRQVKKYNLNHAKNNYNSYYNYYYISTLGWFNYAPDSSSAYKNTNSKTLFVDDLDHMGSLGLAFDMTTVYNHNLGNIDTIHTLRNNIKYFNLYSKLRKGDYFSPAVKEVLREGYLNGKEYKVEEQADGSWAFREMTYVKNRVFDMADDTFVTGSATNPYNEQNPYIRIEQRYSTLGANETVLFEMDETTDVESGKVLLLDTPVSLATAQAFKISVTGNGIDGSAVLLTLGSTATSEAGRLDFFIPTHFEGTRDFILIDTDNADYDGYTFTGVSISSTNYECYRNGFYYKGTNNLKITLAGDCTGVKLGDLRYVDTVNAPATNPSVTIGDNTITFNATVRSGEYIEYWPDLNKAYLHSYDVLANGTNGDTPTISEITFTGGITVPAGDFEFTYNATGTTTAPLRAQVVLGLKSAELIANEEGWTAPTIELEDDIQYITLT